MRLRPRELRRELGDGAHGCEESRRVRDRVRGYVNRRAGWGSRSRVRESPGAGRPCARLCESRRPWIELVASCVVPGADGRQSGTRVGSATQTAGSCGWLGEGAKAGRSCPSDGVTPRDRDPERPAEEGTDEAVAEVAAWCDLVRECDPRKGLWCWAGPPTLPNTTGRHTATAARSQLPNCNRSAAPVSAAERSLARVRKHPKCATLRSA